MHGGNRIDFGVWEKAIECSLLDGSLWPRVKQGGWTVNYVSERIYCEKFKGSEPGSLFCLLQEAVQEAVSQHVFGPK